jgi:hypothetical protein
MTTGEGTVALRPTGSAEAMWLGPIRQKDRVFHSYPKYVTRSTSALLMLRGERPSSTQQCPLKGIKGERQLFAVELTPAVA